MITKEEIIKLLEKHWNIKPAAEELGVGYSTLRKYIKKFNIKHNSRLKKDIVFDRSKYQSEAVTRSRQNKKIKSLEYRGGMICSRCGFNEPIPDCYAFHHRDPTQKDPSWGKMKSNNWSIEKIKEELDKCDVVCHNCHSIIHYNLRKEEKQNG